MTDAPVIVTFITKNDCARCTVVKNKYRKNNVVFTTINAEEDPTAYEIFGHKSARDFVYRDLRTREMPVTIVDHGPTRWWWSGVRLDQMNDLFALVKDHPQSTPVGVTHTDALPGQSSSSDETLVQALTSELIGSLGADLRSFRLDEDRQVVTTENIATIPLVHYSQGGDIVARFTANLMLNPKDPATT